MKSLSLAALLVGFIAFDNLKTCQASRQFTERRSRISEFGDQGEYTGVPVQYLFRSGYALDTDSGGSTSYRESGYGAASREFQGGDTGIQDDGEIYGRTDADQYGGIKRILRRRVILILIGRRPRSQHGGGSGEDREIWGRQGGDYFSGDDSINQRRRLKHLLLRILLKKILLAAARQRSVGEGNEEGQGGDLGTESQWGRSEPGWQSGRRLGEGSDSGSTDAFYGRGGRWGQDGFGVVNGPLLVRLGEQNTEDSSDLYRSGNEQGTQNGPYWIPSKTSSDVTGGIPGTSGEGGGGYFSDAANSGTGYGSLIHMTNFGAGRQRILFNEMHGSASGGLTDLRGFQSSSDSLSAQPATWQGTGSSFPQDQNQLVRSNEGSSYGRISADLQSANPRRNFYAALTPYQVFRRVPGTSIESGQAGSLGESYETGLRETPFNAFSVASNTGYSGVFGGSPGQYPAGSRGFNEAYNGNSLPDVKTASVNTE
ncbi:ATP-dependent RNA helicase glh-2-like [Dermacentor albipictus]|uniref:ATP-dependent RNA helicase glh-2-like n=1 Tax=Dermacentor albipictus TaxID=60249 RepID=UPI0038FC2542